MPLVLADRVQETTTTTGTGTVTLAGAVSGYQSFAVIGDGNTTYYTITSGTAWEVGIGTYTSSGTTLARTTIISSSNSGSPITLAGTSNVFVTLPADKAVVDLADRTAKTYLVGTELMLAEEAGVQYQISASAVLGSSFIVQQSSYTLSNTTSVQQIFNSSTLGRITLPTGVYVFELMLTITAMSATSGNIGFNLVGGGSLSISSTIMYQSVGVDNNNVGGTPLALNGVSVSGTTSTVSPIQINNAGTNLATKIRGVFDVTTAGTLIPSLSLNTAINTATVVPGTYFLARRVAPTGVATVGDWS